MKGASKQCGLFDSWHFLIFILTFLGIGVCRMDSDSVMHSTISSADSAWSKHHTMASPTFVLSGVNSLSMSSSLSLWLLKTLINLKQVSMYPKISLWLAKIKMKWNITNALSLSPVCELPLFGPWGSLLFDHFLHIVFLYQFLWHALCVWIHRRWLPQGSPLEHSELLCPPFVWGISLKSKHLQNDVHQLY